MKMRVVNLEEAKSLIPAKTNKMQYGEIYDAVKKLESGKALVLEFEDPKKAYRTAATLWAAKNYKPKEPEKKSIPDNCYVTKQGCIIIIGKN